MRRKKTPGRAQADESLRAGEEKFLHLLKTLPDGILVLDAETGAITDANPAVEKMLDSPASGLVDKKLWEIEALKNVPAAKGLFQELGRKKHFHYKDLLLNAHDGRRCHVELSGTAYRAGNKRVVQCTFREIAEHKAAEEIMVRQRKELGRLYRASVPPLSSDPFDLQSLAQTVVRAIRQSHGRACCRVYLIQEGSDELNVVAAAGPEAGQASGARLHMGGPGLVLQAIRGVRAINTPDVRAIPGCVPDWEAARAELAIPLLVSERVIGAMDVQSASVDAFNADDIRLMSVLAQRVTLALEHARLYTRAERRIENLASLRMIDRAISGSFDIRFTLGVLLDQVIQQLGVDAADVLVLSLATQTLRYSHGRGFQTRALQHLDLRLDDACAGRAAREKRIVTVQGLDKNCTGMKRAAEFLAEGFVTYVGAPLIAKGQVRGVLEIFQREARALDEEQRAFLEMVAGQAAIAIDGAELFENLQASNAELTMAYDETIEGWSRAMDLRDRETEGHTQRVTELTLRLANNMGFRVEELVHIRRGALLHDIGKMGVPDEILRKPDVLTEEEWVIMRNHPQFAYDMLAPILYLRKSLDIPYCHHEKWDGTGYPRGLKGEEIPLVARIFAVVDVWDALISDRPYRKAWPKDKALEYIRVQAGRHFDPKVVNFFLREVADAEQR